ncbi:MAG: 8-oxo-dGTP diphosphatase MutT [Halieaceae bacterium]|jgi:8-oxo-dGTP diphosphatase|nr:8-oxo-dGTP diphosphatase MutT [Halieaceae bacterium]
MESVHVVVGVVSDSEGRVLIARRAAGSHQGSLWEFPGGKIEAGEIPQGALARELLEELGIETGTLSPFLQITHDYGDKSVLLDAWVVVDYKGTARGREGQPLAWVWPSELEGYPYPAANAALIDALVKAR